MHLSLARRPRPGGGREVGRPLRVVLTLAIVEFPRRGGVNA